ncbi:signal peptidase I [Herbiconiux sp. A18JL235]|uniref:Signal peptidase I n=1 Tax=Herbiconiux sp. A18JL235 TaxID=3152363 RepID=A0AB39BLI4_9MICO
MTGAPAVTGARHRALPPARHRAEGAAGRASPSLLHYLGVALSAASLVLVLMLAVLTILLPLLVGGRALTVLTSSMEPGFPPGTLVVVRPMPAEEIRLGDVLTYQIESGRPGVVSHRVVEKSTSSRGEIEFVTKGDNNDAADEKPVREVQVVGTLWYSIPLLGWVNQAVNGEARSVIVPVAVTLLFGYAGWMLVSAVVDRRKEGRRSR